MTGVLRDDPEPNHAALKADIPVRSNSDLHAEKGQVILPIVPFAVVAELVALAFVRMI